MSTKGNSFFISIYFLLPFRLSCKWRTISIKVNQNAYNKTEKRAFYIVCNNNFLFLFLFSHSFFLGSLRLVQSFSLSLLFCSSIFVFWLTVAIVISRIVLVFVLTLAILTNKNSRCHGLFDSLLLLNANVIYLLVLLLSSSRSS